jgi:hypothetical protein
MAKMDERNGVWSRSGNTRSASNSKCLVGCIDTFTCNGSVPLVLPVSGDNISPWVKARFSKGDPRGMMDDEQITVGNESSWMTANEFGEPHHAAIKSFEYGTTDGHKCTLDVIDEEGGEFFLFVEKLLKCLNKTEPQYFFQVQWGWTIQNCDGDWDFEASPIVTFVPVNLEVSFSDGVIKYKVTGTDAFQISFVAREDEATGSDDAKICLKPAIVDMLGKNEPKVKVQFLKKDTDGTPHTWNFKNNCLNGCGDDGPRSSWNCDNQNKMGTVNRWIQPFRTHDDKGLLFQWETLETTPTTVLWEDNSLECKEKAECNPGRHIGSFIVNGGCCSNVISFNPNINWPAGFALMAQGGNSGSTMNSEGVKKDIYRPGGGGCKPQADSKVGIMQSVELTKQAIDCYGEGMVYTETQLSQMAHNKANVGREGIQPIEAELRIQGNPGLKFVWSQFIHQAYACIVVINPFHLSGPYWDGCGDWIVLADSGCNSILSNRFWKVMGANHQIKEGSYITTLKLQLPVPGVDISPEQHLGSDEPEAYRPMDSEEGAPC